MKKIYQVPEIEVTLMESTELMEASLGVYSDQVEAKDILSRDADMFFDDED